MSTGLAAAVISGSAVVFVGIVSGLGALWRVGSNRRYQRRIAHLEALEDRAGDLRTANRAYAFAVLAAVQKQVARQIEVESPLPQGARDLTFGPAATPAADTNQSNALDRFQIAQSRVEDDVLITVSEHWQRMSRLHDFSSSDVNAGEADIAWDWLLQACAQALNSRRGNLTRLQQRQWQARLDSVVDDSDDTDPELPAGRYRSNPTSTHK